jgi:hypothetical protein
VREWPQGVLICHISALGEAALRSQMAMPPAVARISGPGIGFAERVPDITAFIERSRVMTAATQLTDYLDEIRKQVCTHCVERPPGGPPCVPLGKQCGIELHLPELIDAIHGVSSDSIVPYLDSNRHLICETCARHYKSDCPCPMDYLAVLLVQAVETVDARRAAVVGD